MPSLRDIRGIVKDDQALYHGGYEETNGSHSCLPRQDRDPSLHPTQECAKPRWGVLSSPDVLGPRDGRSIQVSMSHYLSRGN